MNPRFRPSGSSANPAPHGLGGSAGTPRPTPAAFRNAGGKPEASSPRPAKSRECADPAASQGWVDLVGRMEVRTPKQIAEAFRKAGFADVAFFRQETGRSAPCGLHCIVGRKPAGEAA